MSRRSRVFLVDADSHRVAALKSALQGHFDLACVESGQACLDLAMEVPPSLILMDAMLPGLDGYETCRRFREDPHLRFTKIILFAADADLEDRLMGYEHLADDFITEPFDGEELLAKIRATLRLRYEEEMDEFKVQFLNLLSHETKTPLTGILSPARMLRDSDDILPEMRDELTGFIVENGETLQRLVQRAADLCSFMAGRVVLAENPVDLVDLAQGLANDLGSDAAEKSIHFEITNSSTPVVHGDPEKLMRALRTLMSNAIDHSHPNSIVELRISEGHFGAEIQVQNHGEVVDEDQMRYVFDAFRVQDVDRHGRGVGVDLALAREIARAHGGEIDCRPGMGESMVFRMWLPQEQEPAAEPDPPPQLVRSRS